LFKFKYVSWPIFCINFFYVFRFVLSGFLECVFIWNFNYISKGVSSLILTSTRIKMRAVLELLFLSRAFCRNGLPTISQQKETTIPCSTAESPNTLQPTYSHVIFKAIVTLLWVIAMFRLQKIQLHLEASTSFVSHCQLRLGCDIEVAQLVYNTLSSAQLFDI